MRFERLTLLRYGAFSERQISFRDGAKLHLVYGRNEAGKSSALAAISDLLFGFPERTNGFEFLHGTKALRVAASLRAGDGTSLPFRRKRGRKLTLLSDDDSETPLRDDALLPFTGGLSRDVFERAFGLDSTRLRAGADAMLAAEGELGSLLFAAASGLLHLRATKTRLEEDATRIFAPRASKDRLFYQIRERHEDARKEERASQLRAGDWRDLNRAIDELQEEHEAMASARAKIRQKLHTLQRLRQIEPTVAEIDRETARLADFSDLAAYPSGTAERLEVRLHEAARAEEALGVVHDRVQAAEAKLAAIAVDQALIDKAEAISALYGNSGDYAKSQRDLPRVIAERDDYTAQMADLGGRLGIAATDLERLQPTDAALAALESTVNEGQSLKSARETTERRLAEERNALNELAREAPAVPLVDPRRWEDQLLALRPDLNRLEKRDELDRGCLLQRQRLAESAAALVPPVDDLGHIAAAALPSSETLTGHRNRLKAASEELRQVEAALMRNHQEQEALRVERAEAGKSAPPSTAEIDEARGLRDQAFAGLRGPLLGEAAPLSGEAARHAVATFEVLTKEADRLADHALAGAETLARLAIDEAERETQLREAEALERQKTKARETLQEAERAYRELFAYCGVTPVGADDMMAWRGEISRLLDDRRVLLERESELSALQRLADELAPALAAIAEGIGLEEAKALPQPALLRAIEERLRALATTWAESRALAGRREDAELRIKRLEEEGAKLNEQERLWQERFRAAANAVGLSPKTTIAEAAANIRLWERLPDLRRERDARERRVAGMRRDIADFETRVGAVVAEVKTELAGLPAGHAIKLLEERVQEARTDAAQRRAAQTALADAKAARIASEESCERARKALEEALTATPEADPSELIARLRERDRLAADLARCRERLREISDGAGEDAVRTELAAFDRSRAEIDMETLRRDEEQLDQEMAELYARLAEKRGERERLERAPGSEAAAFAKQAAEVEIVEAARQWAVLKLSAALLTAAMEHHRAKESDPMMERAGTLFSMLTDGAFATLAQELNEADEPELKAVRKGGEQIAIAGLSDGTRDQLYLALRLAFLEDYCRHNEAAPFIGDDLFQTFDDERTAAGIKTLAASSTHFQPILFTHHRSVVATAEQALGQDLDLIEI
ncbi:AAA family ATPase [Afifella sp. JA880]|uniref:ATP-binding protein n=1 Tax=Afifella sp. JA880 TaxID=2975280 RepID=UPI0021BB41A3|nr:YhaN family protein [Afifella sp. JA880]MCT8268608.1 AAA family ATPase [Afifella sp. JA880]